MKRPSGRPQLYMESEPIGISKWIVSVFPVEGIRVCPECLSVVSEAVRQCERKAQPVGW